MKKINNYKKYFYILCATSIFLLFLYITYKTPITGDDWGYALNGSSVNPIKMTINFYFSWSGRVLSELWGFIAAPNKWIWNVVNPILYTVSFLCIYRLVKVRKYPVLIPLLICAVMLSVDDNLRMEVYTWLTGTIYSIPLTISLLYFVIMDYLFFRSDSQKHNKTLAIISNILLLCGGLFTENISAMLIVAVILMIIYAHFNSKSLLPYLYVNLASIVCAFLIMRLSPGSAFRLVRDNSEWTKLNLFEKIANAYPNFLEFTFIRNNYLILFLSMVMILLIFSKKNVYNKLFSGVSLILQFFAVLAVFSFVLQTENNLFLDSESLFSMLFWPVYALDVLALLFFGLNGQSRDKAIFMYMMGGGCNLVMLFSPIFGSRSSLYEIYFLITVMCIVLEEIHVNKYVVMCLLIICLGVIFDRINEYKYKYNLVGLVTQERQSQIDYYVDHPEVEEAWIRRYPIYTIHGADIEPGDTYHFETFKEYFGLPQDADKIFFYFEETK